MSPSNISIAVGLATLGLTWSLARGVAGGAEPPARASSEASAPTESVLLLYNGRVVEGSVSQEGANYVLSQKVGNLSFPRNQVEGVFGSIRGVYQYKRDRIAERDPDEHVKMARWCLAMKMTAECREHLAKVVELNPGHREAEAMMANLDAAAERAQRDPAIQQAGAVMGADRPGELDPNLLRDKGQARGGQPLGLPVIFDLPPALAGRRSQDFERFVHPVLQKVCARCHNERAKSNFQLLQARSNRDMADAQLVRTNLEATLDLVDPMNPNQSPLLTSALLPHPPRQQPILSGPKSPSYEVLSKWVQALRPAPPDQAVVAGFASDRLERDSTIQGSPLTPISALPGPVSSVPPAYSPSGAGMSPGGSAMPPAASQALPPAYSPSGAVTGAGTLPGGSAFPPAPSQALSPTSTPNGSVGGSPYIGYGVPTAGPEVQVQAVPGTPPSTPGQTPSPDEAGSSKSKPTKIDPSALEKFLLQRRSP